MNKKIIAMVAALLCFTVAGLFAQENDVPAANSQTVAEAQTEQAQPESVADAVKYIAAAVAVALACIAGGMAVGKIGAAAMGAMSENAELSGKALPFVGLAEGICLWGFLVALLIIIL